MEDKIYNIEYKELLTHDYSRNYLEIKYNENINKFIKVYLYNSEFGTIEIMNNKKEVHKWETEDEAKSGSYLKRNYTIIGLNGITDNKILENKIIDENLKYIKRINIKEKEMEIINKAIQYIYSFK